MLIRQAQSQDAAVIAAAEANIAATPGLLVGVPHEIPLSAYQASIQALQTDGLYVVAENGAELAGHLMLDPMGMVRLAHVLRLSIVVYPNYQGQGLGKRLMQHGINWAQQDQRFDKIELNVRATNQRAIRLYQSLGFVEEGRLIKRIKISDGQYLDDIAMGLFV